MPVTEKPILNTVEIWSLVNLTSEVHPIHLHQAGVRILDRQGSDAPEYLRSQQIPYTDRGFSRKPTKPDGRTRSGPMAALLRALLSDSKAIRDDTCGIATFWNIPPRK